MADRITDDNDIHPGDLLIGTPLGEKIQCAVGKVVVEKDEVSRIRSIIESEIRTLFDRIYPIAQRTSAEYAKHLLEQPVEYPLEPGDLTRDEISIVAKEAANMAVYSAVTDAFSDNFFDDLVDNLIESYDSPTNSR